VLFDPLKSKSDCSLEEGFEFTLPSCFRNKWKGLGNYKKIIKRKLSFSKLCDNHSLFPTSNLFSITLYSAKEIILGDTFEF
jgi:hypothetical protein